MTTPNPSTTPKDQTTRPTGPGAQFADVHGDTESWTADTCDLYLDLYSARSSRPAAEAVR